MSKNNFHYVSVLLKMLYGIQMPDEDVEELGLLAWNKIGNKDVRLYRYSTPIDKVDNSVTLPCNAVELEAVTTNYEDWQSSTNKTEYGDLRTAYIENSIEYEKFYTSPYYMSGKLLKYDRAGDKLYFNKNYGTINILYKGILVDEDGLPELSDNEANAIATFLAYTYKFKEGLQLNNKNLIEQAAALKQLWATQCDQARVTYLNQNDMNNILNVSSSWNRHVYSKSSKPIL